MKTVNDMSCPPGENPHGGVGGGSPDFQHEIYRLRAVVEQQEKALLHWRREYDVLHARGEERLRAIHALCVAITASDRKMDEGNRDLVNRIGELSDVHCGWCVCRPAPRTSPNGPRDQTKTTSSWADVLIEEIRREETRRKAAKTAGLTEDLMREATTIRCGWCGNAVAPGTTHKPNGPCESCDVDVKT